MLEILFLIWFTGKIGKMVESKGHKGGKYKWMAVGLWVAGEFLGAFIGAFAAGSSDDVQCMTYGFALVGAGIGAAIAYAIANRAEPTAEYLAAGKAAAAWPPPGDVLPAPPQIEPAFPPQEAPAAAELTPAQKLAELQKMVNDGLITAEEYETRRREIFSHL